MKPIFKVILLAIAYLATFILGATSGMIPVIDNIPMLIFVYLITIPLAILAIRLATK